MPRPTATQPMPSQMMLGWPERAAVTSAAAAASSAHEAIPDTMTRCHPGENHIRSVRGYVRKMSRAISGATTSAATMSHLRTRRMHCYRSPHREPETFSTFLSAAVVHDVTVPSLDDHQRVNLLFGPSPVHPLPRLSAALG